MKKVIYSVILVGSFILYGIFQSRLSSKSSLFSDNDSGNVTPPTSLQLNTNTDTNTTSTNTADTITNTNTTTTNTNSNSNNSNSNSNTTSTPATKPKGQYKDGTYTGIAADAYYGNIQVKAVISGGKITDVIFLQYPNDRNTSRMINSQAMGYLKAEAIQVQSANVDTVSGASDSSQAFRESLASALNQAKA